MSEINDFIKTHGGPSVHLKDDINYRICAKQQMLPLDETFVGDFKSITTIPAGSAKDHFSCKSEPPHSRPT